MTGRLWRTAGRVRRVAADHAGAIYATAAGGLLMPAPFLFACACTCGTGGVPDALPEAPWQPMLLVAGGGAAFLWWWRRGRRGGPGGGTGGGGVRRRGARHLALLVARVLAVVTVTSVAVGLASAVAFAATPVTDTTPCDCNNSGNPTGGVSGISDGTPTPSVGAGGEILRVAVPMLAGGAALIGASVVVRPRRRRST